MTEWWQQLAAQLGTTAVAMVVLGWLGKTLGERWLEKLDKRDERRHEQELEAFKSQLAVSAHESQARSAVLVARQSETLAELYRLLVQAESSVEIEVNPLLVGIENLGSEVRREAQDAVVALRDYYRTHRIWLAPDACRAMDALLDVIDEARSILDTSDMLVGSSVDTAEQSFEKDAWDFFRERAPEALRAIDAQFRGLLRVTRQQGAEIEVTNAT